MTRNLDTTRSDRPNRREALRRLSGASVTAYVVPEMLFLSAARADSSGPSAPSGPVEPEAPSAVDEPEIEAPSAPETERQSREQARERCNASPLNDSNQIRISRSDFRRSQAAIDAGYAQPLEQIWGAFTSGYDGKVIGVEFIGRQNNPRYRFRAISASGRLETVTISAQTGAIEKIVGCG